MALEVYSMRSRADAIHSQRWIYRVDYSRANEYGQVVEGMAEPVGDVAKVKEAEEKKKQ
jgi:hypothetical protein